MRYGMAIDMERCTGCHACSVACKVENNLPDGVWWNRVLTVGGDTMDTPQGTFPDLDMQFLPINCQHCENPACVKACPVGATFKREEDGVVIQDYDKCIGCRYCMVACPYSGVRQFNWKEPEYAIGVSMGDENIDEHRFNVVEKCTFCSHRLAEGGIPACVETCPNVARFFGDLDDPNSEVSQAIKGRDYFHLLDEQGTKPSIYYLK